MGDGQGRMFSETVNQYDTVTVADGAARAGLEDFTATRFPRLTATDQRFFEGQAQLDDANPTPGKSTATRFQYDALGNVTQYVDTGDAGAADDVTATIGYASCPATYIVGTPNKIVVTANGVELRHREADVNCANGNVTQVREYLSDDQRGGDRPGVHPERHARRRSPGRRTATRRPSASRSSTRTTTVIGAHITGDQR